VHVHDIGGDGGYCGDNDEASGGKYVPRTVLFEPGMIDALRASH
jgi:hypothetical protein